MVLESILIAFVSVYLAIVAFGHVLLVTALLQYIGEDWIGGRRQAESPTLKEHEPTLASAR